MPISTIDLESMPSWAGGLRLRPEVLSQGNAGAVRRLVFQLCLTNGQILESVSAFLLIYFTLFIERQNH